VAPATHTADELIHAMRAAHDRLVSYVVDMDETALLAPSYASEWSIGQVLSHLGSQAEIFELFLDAVLADEPAPGGEVFPPIWDRWNAKAPRAWRDDYIRAQELHIERFEGIDAATRESFRMDFFGQSVDLAGYVRLRLFETAVHAWDVEVMVDPDATIEPLAVPALVDHLQFIAERTGASHDERFHVRVGTSAPARDFVVSVGEPVSIEVPDPDASYDGAVDLPAEAFVRLVYGRLDPDHTPGATESGQRGLLDLRRAFPGV
jgi:uncharacterized protein (TIGR03083 family)